MFRTLVLVLLSGIAVLAQSAETPLTKLWLRFEQEQQILPDSQFHYWGQEETVPRGGVGIGLDREIPFALGSWILSAHARGARGGGIDSIREAGIGGRYAFPGSGWRTEWGLEYGWRRGLSLPGDVAAAGGRITGNGVSRAIVAVYVDLPKKTFTRLEWHPALHEKDQILGMGFGVAF